jgi:hypothetical protein
MFAVLTGAGAATIWPADFHATIFAALGRDGRRSRFSYLQFAQRVLRPGDQGQVIRICVNLCHLRIFSVFLHQGAIRPSALRLDEGFIRRCSRFTQMGMKSPQAIFLDYFSRSPEKICAARIEIDG